MDPKHHEEPKGKRHPRIPGGALTLAGMLAALLCATAAQADTIYLPRGTDDMAPRSCAPGSATTPRAVPAGLQADPDPVTACDDPASSDAAAPTRRV